MEDVLQILYGEENVELVMTYDKLLKVSSICQRGLLENSSMGMFLLDNQQAMFDTLLDAPADLSRINRKDAIKVTSWALEHSNDFFTDALKSLGQLIDPEE